MFLGKAENESEVRLGYPVLRIPVFLPHLPTMLPFRLLFIIQLPIYSFICLFISKGKLDSTRD